ncbi:unannotated protein [freshwater metagenome]|uniref:Unannotated protein n=1 Tax=freshwater metagenome TaxID=449393 RepID=A0A6J6UHN6_9ZZZZ
MATVTSQGAQYLSRGVTSSRGARFFIEWTTRPLTNGHGGFGDLVLHQWCHRLLWARRIDVGGFLALGCRGNDYLEPLSRSPRAAQSLGLVNRRREFGPGPVRHKYGVVVAHGNLGCNRGRRRRLLPGHRAGSSSALDICYRSGRLGFIPKTTHRLCSRKYFRRTDFYDRPAYHRLVGHFISPSSPHPFGHSHRCCRYSGFDKTAIN